MAFETFPPRLKQVAESGQQFFKKRFGRTGFKSLSEISPDINWRPTFQTRPKKSLIVAAEVQDIAYPEILKIAAHDISHFEFPISVYQICPLEIYLAEKNQSAVNLMKRHGFGIVTVDISGRATLQSACIPLAQHIDEKELDSEMKGMSQSLRIRFMEAYNTYRNNEGQGLQEAGQLVESLVVEIAEQCLRMSLVPNGTLRKSAAGMIDDLYALIDLKDHRGALGGARDFAKEFRNSASHPARNPAQAIDKIKRCRLGFINAIRVTNNLQEIFRQKKWRLCLPN